ncbi:MAG: serine protease AprX [Actinomycetota bacterium]|nr:serine protease AprX [Actinomycetota bacterium]
MRLDRAATKLLALASTVGVMGALTVTSAMPAGAATSSGPRHQAIVALAGPGPVSVPGLRVQSYLGAVHAEIVDGTSAQLAQLAAAPGVVGVEANATAHLTSDSFGPSGDSGTPATAPTLAPTTTSGVTTDGKDNSGKDGSGKDGSGKDGSGTAAPSAGVLAASTLGGKAGKSDAGSGVTIAVIDTGVADTAALNRASGRLVDAVDTSGLNSETGHVVEHGVFTDSYGHGTFMASLIAGGKVDGSGKTALGVAPGATVDVVKVADENGDTSLASVLAGLNWVATHADSVDVANLSLSVDRPSDSYGIDPLNYAVTLTRNAGVTVVVAAGNTPGLVGDPGFAPASLTVGSADTTGKKASLALFSGYANVDGVTKPDVVAAGVNVLGEMPADSVIGLEFPNARQPSGLFRGSGTSQSAAIVSGLAALYLDGHHWASPQEVKSAIRDGASSIAGGHTDGQGLVAIPTGNHGPFHTGEQSLNLVQWYSTVSLWGPFWTDDAWDSRHWVSRHWTVDLWDSRHWVARNWTARNWAARNWMARNWSARNWAARNWAASQWGDVS